MTIDAEDVIIEVEVVFADEVMDELVELVKDVVAVMVEFDKVDIEVVNVEFVEFVEADVVMDVIMVEFIVELVDGTLLVNRLTIAILELVLLLVLALTLVILVLVTLWLLADTRPIASAEMTKMMFTFMLLTVNTFSLALYIHNRSIWSTKLLFMATKLLLIVTITISPQLP